MGNGIYCIQHTPENLAFEVEGLDGGSLQVSVVAPLEGNRQRFL
jgi:hypothetical protein